MTSPHQNSVRPSLAELEARMSSGFPDAKIQLTDESEHHAGHAGAQGGAGHYRIKIIHPSFAGLTRVGRHRLVYHAVADWMPHRVHALSIEALTPNEPGAGSTDPSSQT